MDKIKQRIVAIRSKHRLSQAQVAKKMTISLHTYIKLERKIEKGGIKVNGDHLIELCDAYQLDSGDYFLFGKELDRHLPELYFNRQ